MLLCLFLFLAPALVSSQTFITTLPSSETDPIYVTVTVGDDVPLYCAVDTNGPVLTSWRYKRATDPSFELVTIISGELTGPDFLVGRVEVNGSEIPNSGGLIFRTNFTLLNFTTDLNLISFQCGPTGTTRDFTIGSPGKRIKIKVIDYFLCNI